MSDDLIFLKAAGVLLLLFGLFMAWQARSARKNASKGDWPPIEYR